MANVRKEICWAIRDARRRLKLSQGEVAEAVGCKQSAISMFEQGNPTKLNDEVVAKIAERLGVNLQEKPTAVNSLEKETIAVSISGPHTGFCPNAACPTNTRFTIEGRDYYRIDRTAADPVGGRFCALCGEVLERKCPNCGRLVHDGAICSYCGEPYVVV